MAHQQPTAIELHSPAAAGRCSPASASTRSSTATNYLTTPSPPPPEDQHSSDSASLLCCTEHTRPDGTKRRDCRCNFMLVFVLIAILQVAVSCVLIWYISYRRSLHRPQDANLTVGRLTTQLRTSILRDVLFELNAALAAPIKAAHQLRYMTENRWPDFGDRLSITNDTGWLADLSFIQANYPTVSRTVIANRRQLIAGMWSPFSETAISPLASSGQMIVELGQPTSLNDTTVDYKQFIARPIRNVTVDPPFKVDGDILPTDSTAAISRFFNLSQPVREIPYSNLNSAYWPDAQELVASGLEGGWSDSIYLIAPPIHDNFFGLAALSVVPDHTTGELAWLAFTVLPTSDLHNILATLDLGPHGSSYLVRPQGRCTASSSLPLTMQIDAQRNDIDMRTSNDTWLPMIYDTLWEWGLVTDLPITTRNATSVIPYRTTLYERSLSLGGDSWTIQAKMVDISLSGLPFTIVCVSRDSDFQGGIRENNITTAWLSVVVGVAAILLSIIAARSVTQPLMHVVRYMDRAVAVIDMDRSEKQREALSALCEQWAGDSDLQAPSLKATARRRRMSLMRDHASPPPAAPASRPEKRLPRCFYLGRGMHEVRLMQRAFGSMLYSLASYDELEAINQAKRAFIRYIFHEVRVPFNAIVLGIDHMQLEVKSLQQLLHGQVEPSASVASCVDVLAILREQSDVVSHILNDVLSMQKIEDGALVLEVEPFNVESMIRGALFAFRAACVEKRLRVDLKTENLDTLINTDPRYIPWLRRDKDACLAHMQVYSEASLRSSKAAPSGTPIVESNSAADGKELKVRGDKSPACSPLAHTSTPTTTNEKGSERERDSGDLNGQNDPLELGVLFTQEDHFSLSGPREVMYHAQIKADNYRLRQVLSNLLSNSIKFTPAQGSIFVQLEFANFVPAQDPEPDSLLRPEYAILREPYSPGSPRGEMHAIDVGVEEDPLKQPAADGDHPAQAERLLGTILTRFTVRDTGVGISPENARQMFQQYAQVAANKNQAGGGTGLGLSISKSIVEAMGGSIGMQSTPGLGSEFWFQIPAQVILVESGPHSRLTSSIISSDPSKATNASSAAAGAHSLQQVALPPPGPLSPAPDDFFRIMPAAPAATPEPAPTGSEEALQVQEVASVASAPLPPLGSRSSSVSSISLRPPVHAQSSSLSSSSWANVESLQQAMAAVPLSGPTSYTGGQGMLGHQHAPAQDLAHFVHSSPTTPTPDRAACSHASNGAGGTAAANIAPITLSHTPAPCAPTTSPPIFSPAETPSSVVCAPAADSKPCMARQQSQSRRTPIATCGSSLPAGLRVLVVEDSPPNRKLLLSLLKHMKCEAEGVENGKLCIDLFPPASCGAASDGSLLALFDIIIMDGSMPVMNGVEATQLLRARGLTIPIIALTGNALAEDQAAFLSAGADIVLTKPINRVMLQKTLAQWAPRSGPAMPPAPASSPPAASSSSPTAPSPPV